MEEVFLHIDMETRLSALWPEDVRPRSTGGSRTRRPAVEADVSGSLSPGLSNLLRTTYADLGTTTQDATPTGDESRVMTFLSLTVSVLAPLLVAGAALTLTGCDSGIDVGDSPLGATADRRGTVIGEPVTGTVRTRTVTSPSPGPAF